MKNMNVIITMGGLGSRFTQAGYQIPKYMIQAKEKTLFEWSLESLRGYEQINNVKNADWIILKLLRSLI